MDRIDRVGRRLILCGCSYEVVALQVEDRKPEWSRWVPPLSRILKRFRWHRVGTPVGGGLTVWLLIHLWIQG